MVLNLFVIDTTKTLNIYLIIISFVASIIMMFSDKTRTWGGFILFLLGFMLLYSGVNILLCVSIIIGGIMAIIFNN